MKKNKLILTMYIGVITLAVASVSMSVAWFAASRRLNVNSINITIDTDRDLKISESRDDGFVEHIYHVDKDSNGLFMPLTSAHSSLWKDQKNDRPIFYDESNCSETEHFVSYRAVEEGYGYFTQKYYLLADDDVYVTIDPDKTVIEANEEYNSLYADELVSFFKEFRGNYLADPVKYQEEAKNLRYVRLDELDLDKDELNEEVLREKLFNRLNNVAKAMRFSVLIKDGEEYSYAVVDPNKEEETLLGGLLDNSVDQYYDSYLKENTSDWYERVYGEVSGVPVYDEPLAQDSDFTHPEDVNSAFNARHKKGVKTFNLDKSIENGFIIEKENSYSLDDFRNNPKFHFPVHMDTPKEVIVCVYLEGWDLDSVNFTMKATFNADLAFKIEREI